nr:Cbl interacting protein of 85 kDa [Hymenolepis microstoma]
MEVEVEYDYTAEERDELTLKRGDIVTNVSPFEEGWFIGTFKGREGVFPDNFVRIIKPAPNKGNQNDRSRSTPVPNPSSVVHGNSKDQVAKNDKNQSVSPTPTTPAISINTKASDYVKVGYAYTPEQPDELELEVKDFIQVLSRDLPEEGWWRGVNLRTNKTGVFPDNFVKMADANDPDFKRVIADLKAKAAGSPSSQRAQNGLLSTPKTNQNNPTSPHGSRRYDSVGGRNDLRRQSSAPENVNTGGRRSQRPSTSADSGSMQRLTDGRPAGRTEGTRTSSRGDEGAVAKPVASKGNAASLSRVDPNRMSEMSSPRNINDLQRIVNDQQERLSAIAKQLENLGHIVETTRREQREQADDVAGQLRDFIRQLSEVKSAQLNNQTSVANGMKSMTERIYSIMMELDELKKAREGDVVDMNRMKKVIKEIDSRTMLPGTSLNGNEDNDGQLGDVKVKIDGRDFCDPYPSSRSSKPPIGHR